MGETDNKPEVKDDFKPFNPADSYRLTCVLCGHTWTKRLEKLPAVCPNCKRYEWNNSKWEVERNVRPRKKNSGLAETTSTDK